MSAKIADLDRDDIGYDEGACEERRDKHEETWAGGGDSGHFASVEA